MQAIPLLNRRRWLQVGAIGLAGPCLPAFLQAKETGGVNSRAKASACILVYLDGGPSHLDLWDLKPEAPAEIRGPFKSVATTVEGLQVCDEVGDSLGARGGDHQLALAPIERAHHVHIMATLLDCP